MKIKGLKMLKKLRLIRLKEVLQIIPISRSSWLRGVNSGRYPPSVKLSKRTVAWRESEIIELINSM